MNSTASARTELRRSLRHLVKGLSLLFWGLPLSLLIYAQTSVMTVLRPFGILPAAAVAGMLLYGTLQLEKYRLKRDDWNEALDKMKLFGLVNLGLSPFTFLASRQPYVEYYADMVGFLGLTGLLFLFSLNRVLKRLGDALPDDALREETRLFTSINLGLIIGVVIIACVSHALQQFAHMPRLVILRVNLLGEGKRFLLMFLILLPLAMTMTLLWKSKEAALAGVFEQDVEDPEPIKPATAKEIPADNDDFVYRARKAGADSD